MRRALAAGVGLLLVADVVGLATVSRNDDHTHLAASVTTTVASSPTTSAAPAATSTTVPDRLTALVHELQAFDEAHRGLKFSQPLKVSLLADADFRTRVLALS